MLVINRLGAGAARYYVDGPATGRWAGAGASAAGLEGAVDPAALRGVLAGRPPSGDPVAPRPVAHRRAGWDLVFAAPKSVSLLVGLAPPPRAEVLEQAQRAAVGEALAWLEGHACRARRSGHLVGVDGVVAACYDHRRSAAGDPHLHTHVLLANLVRAGDGRWSALADRQMWVGRRALSAAYHLALRHHLGVDGGWRLGADGTFDLAAVPRPAIEVTSRRGAEIAVALADRSAGEAAEAPAAARRAARVTTRTPAPEEWWAEVGSLGFGPAEAGALTAGSPHPAEPSRLDAHSRAVADWLLARRSTFGPADVMEALAATVPAGSPAAEAQSWAERFCAASPATGARRTTPAARHADLALEQRAERGAGRGLGTAPAWAIEASLARRPGLGESAAGEARRLAGSGHAVDVLDSPGRDGLVAQAAVLDAARAAWQSAGHTVEVVCEPPAARRWRALTSLTAGGGGPAPTVLVVDRADRVPTPQLAAILERAERAPAKVVLVRGGTLPARRRAVSEGFEGVAEGLGASFDQAGGGRPATGPELRAGALVVCAGTHQAVEAVVAEWSRRPGALMVGLGPAEVAELNSRARDLRRRAGTITGPELRLAGRDFAAGDLVLPLRGSAGPPGALGRVVDAGGGRLTVDWGERTVAVDHWAARHLGHAYAVTPAGLRLREGRAFVLGEPAALGRLTPRVAMAAVLAPASYDLARGGPERDDSIFRREALARLVELGPGRARSGPAREAPGLSR